MSTDVLFVSSTGNTAAVAGEIFKALPSPSKDIHELGRSVCDNDSDCYFIGFWVNRGSANIEVLDFLSGLHGKKIALFGTCGMGNTEAYYRKIEHRILAFLPDDNQFYGSFFCQGKMPIRVRQKYELLLDSDHRDMAQQGILNFDQALFHPSQKDYENAASFARITYEKMLKEATIS